MSRDIAMQSSNLGKFTLRNVVVVIIRRHGSVSALKCMRDEMHRVPLREPASCEHPWLPNLNNGWTYEVL